MWKPFRLPSLVLCLAACTQDGAKDTAFRRQAVARLKQHLMAQVDDWVAASVALQEAAPVGEGNDDGWAGQAEAKDHMKSQWSRARRAYELVEGALAPLFPASDVATDSRYEDFLVRSGGQADTNSFDDTGVVGMHAIERILWADAIPPAVIAYEETLPGFTKPTQPANTKEATDFKTKLAAKLVADTKLLRDQLAPLEPDIAFVYRGLLDLVREQVEKVDKTASGEEESRYAQATMADLKANLDGTRAAFDIIGPWVREKDAACYARIQAAFASLEKVYAQHTKMPTPPPGWSSLDPGAAALATPFGQLFAATKKAADPKEPLSLLAQLRVAAQKLGLPEMP